MCFADKILPGIRFRLGDIHTYLGSKFPHNGTHMIL